MIRPCVHEVSWLWRYDSLVAEDMGPRVGAFGDLVALTPNLDKLASRGVRYPNTFTTAGVCAPSRAALITGMHQISIGAQHMRTSTRPAGDHVLIHDATLHSDVAGFSTPADAGDSGPIDV